MGSLLSNAELAVNELKSQLEGAAKQAADAGDGFAQCAALAAWKTAPDGTKFITDRDLMSGISSSKYHSKTVGILQIVVAYEKGEISGQEDVLTHEDAHGGGKYFITDKDSELWKAIDAAQQLRRPSSEKLGSTAHDGKAAGDKENGIV